MQIRVRLTLQFILIASGILLAAFSYIYFQFKRNLQDEFYANLRSKALLIAEMVAGKKSSGEEFKIESFTASESFLSGEYPENISIYDLDGRRLYSFNPAPDDIRQVALMDVKVNGECRFIHRKFNALGVLYTNKAGGRFIIVAESVFDNVHLNNLTRILILVFLIAITMIACGGWLFSRQALAPISRIMNQVDALLPTDMSHRLVASNQHDELSRLVITFNKLLDRIQSVFRMQKMFLSNISHELKNPLNVITSQVEVTLGQERQKEVYRGTLQSVLADVKELNNVTDKLMQLARISSDGATIHFEKVRADELIWQAKEMLLKHHPEYTIRFEVVNLPDQESKLYVKGNEQLLKTALVNLMDNGCKYSPDHQVEVRLLYTHDGRTRMEIADQGPGISQEESHLVFDAFYRSPKTSGLKGSGIGLSLVDSILKLHQVDIQLKSESGKGTHFILTFPAESKPEPVTSPS